MKLPVYLYDNTFEVIVDLDNNNRINQVMYQRDLKLQKGLKNTVQLQFKNSDQKLIDMRSKQAVFVLFDTVNQRNLIEKDIRILDTSLTTATTALKGLGSVTFTESDLEACESVAYRAGIKVLDTDGSYTPAYANTYYGVGATVHVSHDIMPVLVPSQEVSDFDVYYNADQDKRQYEYYSGNLNAHPEFKSNTALHTIATYMTRYRGRVLIEGTLETDPATFGNYAIISDKSYTVFTGIDYTNFNGVFAKIRVRYIPTKDPVSQENNVTSYAGTVDKILYRS
jgi:hypothetical protein